MKTQDNWAQPYIWLREGDVETGPFSPEALDGHEARERPDVYFWVSGLPAWAPIAHLPVYPEVDITQPYPSDRLALPVRGEDPGLSEAERVERPPSPPSMRETREAKDAALRSMMCTTLPHKGDPLGVVTAQSVVGVSLKKELIAAFSDFTGGRSKTMEAEFAAAREACMAQLREQAGALGASVVAGIRFEHVQLTGQGKSMIAVMASGTAVSMRSELDPPSGR